MPGCDLSFCVGPFVDWMLKPWALRDVGIVILVSVLFQGLNAIYYFTRRKHVDAYVQNTPEWVLNLNRLTSSD